MAAIKKTEVLDAYDKMIQEAKRSKKEYTKVIKLIDKNFPKLPYSCHMRGGDEKGISILTISFKVEKLTQQEKESFKTFINSLGYNLSEANWRSWNNLSIFI